MRVPPVQHRRNHHHPVGTVSETLGGTSLVDAAQGVKKRRWTRRDSIQSLSGRFERSETECSAAFSWRDYGRQDHRVRIEIHS